MNNFEKYLEQLREMIKEGSRTNNITVIDAMCGAGKTSFAIQEMKENGDRPYIYVTPFLAEIDRIRYCLPHREFLEPTHEYGRKINKLNDLLCDGKNIAVTHSTFLNANEETLHLIQQGNYVLILDEVLDVVTDYNNVVTKEHQIRNGDVKFLVNEEIIKVDQYGRVSWATNTYKNSRYEEIERLARNGSLILMNETLFFWEFPIEIFKSFEDVWILTYLFEGSILKYFLDYHGVKYKKSSIKKENDKYQLAEYSSEVGQNAIYKDLITILDDNKLNDYPATAFTSTWYKKHVGKNKDSDMRNKIKNDVYNFFRHKSNATAKDVMWTCYEDSRKAISNSGYTIQRKLDLEEKKLPERERNQLESQLSCFVSCNARSSNDYRERSILAYLCNMWPNPYLEKYFALKRITMDREKFALSYMIQWIWRSRIRNMEPISIYIPSKRMRNLLLNWIND